jgi:hypothetical protein
MIEEARAAQIVERIIFGGSFVSARPAPNDFDCIVVLHFTFRTRLRCDGLYFPHSICEMHPPRDGWSESVREGETHAVTH